VTIGKGTPALRPGVTLVLGGARSGKSRFAEGLVEASGLARVYVATAQALDAEMSARIALHRERRGGDWLTIDAPLELPAALAKNDGERNAILVDCLTLWVTNLMLADADIAAAGDRLIGTLAAMRARVVLVANEVGLGIVPDNAMARAFRDHAGTLNQRVAAAAHTVFLVAAGLPLALKQD
jgi:adenosylcobinamide kinase/adenosylcobinamide-phosphate guanylyltransferase